MEFEKFLSKYNRRCKALTLGYRYLHEATMEGTGHLNAQRAASFIDRVEIRVERDQLDGSSASRFRRVRISLGNDLARV